MTVTNKLIITFSLNHADIVNDVIWNFIDKNYINQPMVSWLGSEVKHENTLNAQTKVFFSRTLSSQWVASKHTNPSFTRNFTTSIFSM